MQTEEHTLEADGGITEKTTTTDFNYDGNGNMLYQRKSEITKYDTKEDMPTPTFSAYIAGQTSTNPEDKYSNEIAGWATSNKYDVFNQLIETVAGKSVINVYNGEGLRTRKISGGKSAITSMFMIKLF